MPDLDLDELERVCLGAPRGPWWLLGTGGCHIGNSHRRVATALEPGAARFITAARTALPALVARVRELEGWAARVRPYLDAIEHYGAPRMSGGSEPRFSRALHGGKMSPPRPAEWWDELNALRAALTPKPEEGANG